MPYQSRLRAVPPFRGFSFLGVRGERKDLPTTHKETKYAHFSLLSSWLCIRVDIIYIQLNLTNRNCSLSLSCLFIKSTFNLEIIYSIITTYQIWLTGKSISTNGDFALYGQRAFRFLMCCRQFLQWISGQVKARIYSRKILYLLVLNFQVHKIP